MFKVMPEISDREGTRLTLQFELLQKFQDWERWLVWGLREERGEGRERISLQIYTNKEDKDAFRDKVSTWRPCLGRRRMRSLNPSAQMGDPLGKVTNKCHDAIRWNRLTLVQAGTQQGLHCNLWEDGSSAGWGRHLLCWAFPTTF